MDFRQIEAFVNVIKYKSFSKAAEALFLTQPTVSTHVNTLEKELHSKLIERGAKEAIPTREGQIFFEYALNMLRMREQAAFALDEYASKIQGIVEIQASSIPAQYILPEYISKFKEKYPEVKYYLEQSDSEMVIENLLEKKGEIGFTGSMKNCDLTFIELMRDEMVLLAPNNEKFSAFKGSSLGIGDFINEPFVWREQGSGTRKAFEACLIKSGYSPKNMNIIARMNSMEAIKEAVSCGLGVSIMSTVAAASKVGGKKYLTFKIKDFKEERHFYLAFNRKVKLSPVAEAFRDFILSDIHKDDV